MNGQLAPGVVVGLDALIELLAKRVADQLKPTANRAAEERSPWMSVDSAARYLDWPKQRLYKLTASGAIPHYKHDGRLLFHSGELDHWLHGYAEGTRTE